MRRVVELLGSYRHSKVNHNFSFGYLRNKKLLLIVQIFPSVVCVY